MTLPQLSNRPGTSGGGFRALIVGLFLLPWTVLWGSWAIVTGLLRLSRVAGWGLTLWARGICALSGIRVESFGTGAAGVPRPCVFLVNHQSALDIPILFVACRGSHEIRFLAKESLFKIPFLGWGMSVTGFVPIRRESARHSAQVFKSMLKSGSLDYSYVVFPEGTRSEDGRLQPLKRGTLGLALRLGLPVVPVSLVDACRANPKHSYLIRSGTVRVVFHSPIAIPAEESDRAFRDELTEKVTLAIASALPDDQKPAASMANSSDMEE